MLVIATHNNKKFQEIQTIISPIICRDCSHLNMTPPEETAHTFIENALIKARAVATLAKAPCIADDSGLVVPALEGKPGIYSARFAGKNATDEENRHHLLNMMHKLPDEQRQAYFYCVMVYLQHAQDPTPIIAIGQWYGQILREERGHLGFGYDSLFFVPSHTMTAAEMPSEEKNKISHRALALNQLKQQLMAFSI